MNGIERNIIFKPTGKYNLITLNIGAFVHRVDFLWHNKNG